MVTAPAAEQADDIPVNMRTEESHSPSDREGASVDVGREEAKGGSEKCG